MLVAGAQRGIGFACAEAFASAGATVACADLPDGSVAEACARLAPGSHTAHEVDLAEPKTIGALVTEVATRHGRIDVVVSAAGFLVPSRCST